MQGFEHVKGYAGFAAGKPRVCSVHVEYMLILLKPPVDFQLCSLATFASWPSSSAEFFFVAFRTLRRFSTMKPGTLELLGALGDGPRYVSPRFVHHGFCMFLCLIRLWILEGWPGDNTKIWGFDQLWWAFLLLVSIVIFRYSSTEGDTVNMRKAGTLPALADQQVV